MKHNYNIRIFIEAIAQVYSESELRESVKVQKDLAGFLKVPESLVEILIEGALQIRALRSGRSLQGIGGEVVQ